jgi:hypothetical protein
LSQLKLPEGVQLVDLAKEDAAVVTIYSPRAEEPEAVVAAATDAAAPAAAAGDAAKKAEPAKKDDAKKEPAKKDAKK